MHWIEPRKHGCRISVYKQRGLHMVTLENRSIRVTVLPDKGSDIVELRLKGLDLDVLWSSPIGMRDPRTTRPSSEGMGAFMDLYEGGWQEVLPSGGPPSALMGASWGQHGETTTLPWEWRVETDRPEEVAVSLRLRLLRYPLLVHKVLRVRDESATLEIEERLCNEGGETVDLMWGHHPTVGESFLSALCRFQTAGGTVRVPEARTFDTQRAQPGATGTWPTVSATDGGTLDLSRMPSPEGRTAEFLYITDMAEGWFAMINDDLGAGYGMCWDTDVFPHLWYWQVARGAFGYPWYGRTYSMALEPWTSWPGDGIAEAVRRGTALRLGSGEERTTVLHAVLWQGRGPIDRLTSAGPTS
jgi:Domain of unknown function (DUF4432)